MFGEKIKIEAVKETQADHAELLATCIEKTAVNMKGLSHSIIQHI